MKTGIKRLVLLLVAAVALFIAGAAPAQQVPPPPDPNVGYVMLGPGPGGPGLGPGEMIGFVGVEEGVGGKTVTGAPFTATFSTQSTQSLADGNQIQHSTAGTLVRDSQGRTRRDLTLPSIGPWAASGKTPPHVVVINDPVGDANYILEPDTKVARKMQWIQRGGRNAGGPAGSPSGATPEFKGNKDIVTTSLGTQKINGVLAEGTRYKRTIPAGAIGNQNPIVITTERWYSADLQIVVLTKQSDPRMGETITQLTNIQRSEPDASLFQVPSDYTVKQGGPGSGGRGMRHHGPPPPPPDDGSAQPPTQD
jgi:hypothetical protein